MPASPSWCWIAGRVVPWAEARVPVEDRGLQFGESLYEVLPVTAGRPRLLEAHAARLARGADELGLESGAPDAAALDEIADELIRREEVDEGLVYIQLTGGTAPREHAPATPPQPALLAYLRPHHFPRAADVERGLRAVTVPDLRWGRCDLKTTMLLPAVLAKREAAARGADEAIFVAPDGAVREGASTSLMAVLEGAIVTPEASAHLLPGTMSALVREAADRTGFEFVSRRIEVGQLADADELLLSATSKLVLPVLALDSRPVGDGRAGPVARRLAGAVRERLELE